MTEPIRLWALRNKHGRACETLTGVPLSYRTEREASSHRWDGDSVVELTEVRRCGTCRNFASDRLLCWSFERNVDPDEWCSRHNPKEKTNG